jgi:hypothetical protein
MVQSAQIGRGDVCVVRWIGHLKRYVTQSADAANRKFHSEDRSPWGPITMLYTMWHASAELEGYGQQGMSPSMSRPRKWEKLTGRCAFLLPGRA